MKWTHRNLFFLFKTIFQVLLKMVIVNPFLLHTFLNGLAQIIYIYKSDILREYTMNDIIWAQYYGDHFSDNQSWENA